MTFLKYTDNNDKFLNVMMTYNDKKGNVIIFKYLYFMLFPSKNFKIMTFLEMT